MINLYGHGILRESSVFSEWNKYQSELKNTVYWQKKANHVPKNTMINATWMHSNDWLTLIRAGKKNAFHVLVENVMQKFNINTILDISEDEVLNAFRNGRRLDYDYVFATTDSELADCLALDGYAVVLCESSEYGCVFTIINGSKKEILGKEW